MLSQLQQALDQIAFARGYTLQLLETIAPEDWYRKPPAGVSHIAWQVGHLAMAEYRLTLERMRGRQPGDEHLISELFLLQFGRDSVPAGDPTQGPTPAELRQMLDRVHQQALHELPHYTDEDLQEPPLKPHKLFATKLGGLVWCAQHELIHAGQIGLLRRQLGQAPLW